MGKEERNKRRRELYYEKQAAKLRAENKEAMKPVLINEIKKHGTFSDEEAEFIYDLNGLVMSVDGTAEQWAQNGNPIDYVERTVEIYEKTKSWFGYFNH